MKEKLNQNIDWSGITILIVEDTDINNNYFKAAFKHTNASIVFTQNGKEALDYLNQNHNVDLILMDIYMPVMNGYETTSTIKSKWPYIPIIMQTAYNLNGQEELSYISGCDEFLTKPIPHKKLISTVSNLLKRV